MTDFAKEILADDDVDLSAENSYATDHIHQKYNILYLFVYYFIHSHFINEIVKLS